MNNREILQLVEWVASNDKIKEYPPEKQTNSDKLLLFIYRVIHSHREDHCCREVHKDWREEAKKTYEDNKKYF